MSKEYNGDPIDASWQTAPWNNDGETIDAHDSEGDGEIMTVDWPENATDREDLNENQRQLITTAARYPSVNDPQELLDLGDIDMSYGYPQQTLINHWPERYWGKTARSNSGEDADVDERETSKRAENNVAEIRQRLLDGGSVNQMIKEYQEDHKRISEIARGVADDIPECDVPPLRWNESSPQQWEKAPENKTKDVSVQELRQEALSGKTAVELADEFNGSSKTIRYKLNGKGVAEDDCGIPPLEYGHATGWTRSDGGEGERMEENTETHSVTSDPVRHTPEPESSSLPAWVWAVVGAAFMWLASKLRN